MWNSPGQITPGVNNPTQPTPISGPEPGGVTTYTYAATISINPTLGVEQKITTVNSVGNATLNAASVLGAGARLIISITNDATSSKFVAFGTNFLSEGGVVGIVGQTVTVEFISDGVYWIESGRAVTLEQLPNTLDTMTYAATISLAPSAGRTHETTTNATVGNATINASAVLPPGYDMLVVVNNDATAARTITFGTNFRSSAVLTGTTSKAAIVSFISDGVSWFETARATGL